MAEEKKQGFVEHITPRRTWIFPSGIPTLF